MTETPLERKRRLGREATARHRARHRDRLLAERREWRAKNPELARERDRKEREANAERIRATQARWRERNREQERARTRAYHAADRQKSRAANRAFYAANIERERERRRRRQAAEQVASPKTFEYVQIINSDPCAYCGGQREEIDHIDPISRGGPHDWVNLTSACVQCNGRKRAKPLLRFLLDEVRL